MNKANINSMIIINNAQELVISFDPASGLSVESKTTSVRLSSHHRIAQGTRRDHHGKREGELSACVPSGSVSSDARPIKHQAKLAGDPCR